MKLSSASALLLLLGLMVSCQDSRPALRAELERNRALWVAQGIASYRFTLEISVGTANSSYTITVSQGSFQSAIETWGGEPAPEGIVAPFRTIEVMFQTLDAQIESNGLETVTYDARGVPVSTRSPAPSCPFLSLGCGPFSTSITDLARLP